MNSFLLSPDERLADWKTFRKSLSKFSEIAQLEKVADYWAMAPLRASAYYPPDATAWPCIWEMIHAGQWCNDTVATGMEATLRLAGWHPDRLTLCQIQDEQRAQMSVVLQIDREWALNYQYGQLMPWPTSPQRVLKRWRHKSKSYVEIGG